MRKRHSKEGLTVNAVAGTHVVLLGWTIADADRANLRGFAVRRTDHTEEETYWVKGTKTFKSVNLSGDNYDERSASTRMSGRGGGFGRG